MYKVADLQTVYNKKLTSTDEAVKVIKSGDRVHYGVFNGIVYDLDKALAKRKDELFDVKIYSTIWVWPDYPEILKVDPESRHFNYFSTHFSQKDRQMNKEGRCWTVPVKFGDNLIYWRDNFEQLDVLMLQVAPMDKYGNFNTGCQNAEISELVKKAKIVIVEINENQPEVQGILNTINLADIDIIVEGSNPEMPEILPKSPSEVDKKIAKHIVERIGSGSTLQLGVGGLPNYVGSMIAESDIGDLSVHSEMFVDAYLKLYEEGKITGNKNLDKGKMVFTFGQGSKKLYEFMDKNPLLMQAPVGYVNALEVIQANDKVVSINSCLQVDLFGQVNSESSKWQHIGGMGGQLDFVMGALHSKGGQSFLCTPSVRVNKDGSKESLITPRLIEGSIVTVPRACTHHIVTEFGIVNTVLKSTWEIAEALISIAHPDFRDDLVKEAEKMGIWKKTSKIIERDEFANR